MGQIQKQLKNMEDTKKTYQRIKKLSDANELIKSKGPKIAYQELIRTMDRSGAASGMLTEEEPADTSESYKKLKSHFERYAPALVARLDDLTKKSTDKEGRMPDYLFKWIGDIKKMLDPALKAGMEAYEKLSGEPVDDAGDDKTDTDGDGIPDKDEIEAGTDPKDDKDPPPDERPGTDTEEEEDEADTVDPDPSKEQALQSAFS